MPSSEHIQSHLTERFRATTSFRYTSKVCFIRDNEGTATTEDLEANFSIIQ